ncbi:MAG: hypothetical protein AABY22_05830 [Nanoarchaeota archaeon]
MKTYKCLAPGCDRQLEKKYLYCSLECCCYGGFTSGCQVKGPIREFYRRLIRKIIYKIHMIIRSFDK